MHPARVLASALEPVVGSVYFAPECHRGYAALGFDPSAREMNGVALPDGPAYFTSRGSLLGHVPGELVAAAFAVFNPVAVVPSVTLGWTRTDAATIRKARHDGAVEHLRRLLGDAPSGVERARALLGRAVAPLRPEGRPLFAGVLAQDLPTDALAAVWQLGDQLREYRGDSHTAAWISEGIDATEIGLLSELYWGLPMRTYSRSRAWSEDDFDVAHDRLRTRGLVDDTALTAAGRVVREAIEDRTDAQMAGAISALGDDVDELVALLTPWGETIRNGKGYPASGPHDLAEASAKR